MQARARARACATVFAMASLSPALSMRRRLSRSQLMPRPATATLPSSAYEGAAPRPSWCASVVSRPWRLGVMAGPAAAGVARWHVHDAGHTRLCRAQAHATASTSQHSCAGTGTASKRSMPAQARLTRVEQHEAAGAVCVLGLAWRGALAQQRRHLVAQAACRAARAEAVVQSHVQHDAGPRLLPRRAPGWCDAEAGRTAPPLTCDGHACERPCRHVAVHLGVAGNGRQHGGRRAKQLQRWCVPAQRRELHEVGARRVGDWPGRRARAGRGSARAGRRAGVRALMMRHGLREAAPQQRRRAAGSPSVTCLPPSLPPVRQ